MKASRCCQVLIMVFVFIPSILFGFDLPGYMTMHGKIIDADTLKPIEGAVVYAAWRTCRPGIGSGSCRIGPAKEALTDAYGEWEMSGPKGNDDPGYIRSVFGFFVPWIESPEIGYYKSGYFPFHKKPGIGDFSAYTYIDKAKGIEGIILYRRDNLEEWKRYLELSRRDDCVTLIPVKDPERKLRELDFDFRYPESVKRIYVPGDLTRYKVIGLKRAVTAEEKREARGLVPSMFTLQSRDLPLLMKALKER